jgi:AcrR family transcriptional regulator
MGRPREFDEEKALEAVRAEFCSKGFTATSVDDLARVTGLGKGSLYGAFGDKHHLFLSVLKMFCEEKQAQAQEDLDNERPAIQRLRALFRRSCKAKDDNTPYRGCLLANSTTELASHDSDVRDLARQTYKVVEALIVDAVQQAQQDGDLAPDVRPEELARLLLAVRQGLEFFSKTGMSDEELDTIRQAVDHLLLGQKYASK